jgi:hypothetical protein
MMALWCCFSLRSIICGVALEAETNGGEVKSCQPELCYAQSCLFGRCYARLIFLGGVDNSSDKGFADLFPKVEQRIDGGEGF